MNTALAPIELPRRVTDVGRVLADGPEAVSAALSEFDTRLENLRLCVHWLVDHGVHVIASAINRAGGIVTVAGSVQLHRLIGKDYAWRKRQHTGLLTIYTNFAVRFETRIEWEEEKCA